MDNIRKTEKAHTAACYTHSVSETVKERLKEKKMETKYIWIAREEDIEDKYSDAYLPGKLSLFYDTPLYVYNSKKERKEWGCARKISEIPNYMFPEVTFKNSPIKFKMEI